MALAAARAPAGTRANRVGLHPHVPDTHTYEADLWGRPQVYRAMLGGMTQVAVKVLHERDEDISFAREIAILRSCRHSNIVQFLVGRHPGSRHFALPDSLSGQVVGGHMVVWQRKTLHAAGDGARLMYRVQTAGAACHATWQCWTHAGAGSLSAVSAMA